ncbi:MAG: site-2 protease family protein [bacterium]
MIYLISAICLGLLILIHEFGHFIAARASGIPVAVFSVGFGPAVIKWKRGDTEFRLSAVPFGGYVLPAIEDEAAYFALPVSKRIYMAIGGPAANVILPISLFFFKSLFSGHISIQGLIVTPVAETVKSLLSIVISMGAVFAQPDQMSGMVGIVAFGGKFLSSGFAAFAGFMMFLSLNLAIFNLFPFPFLDGGKIILCLLEKVHPKMQRLHAPLTIAGMVCLAILIVYTTYQDIGRLVA